MINKSSSKILNGKGKAKVKPKKNQKNKNKNKKPAKQDIPSTSLAWSAVPLPFEATAQAGQSDADFFQGFSVDDHDFMGLTEVEGVDVVRDSDGIIRFMVDKEEGTSKGAGKGKSKEQKKKTELASEGEKNGVEAEESAKSSEQADLTKTVELPRFDFDEEAEVDEGRSEDDDEINADFALLAEDSKGDQKGTTQWSQKDTAKKLPSWKKLDVKLHSLLYQALYSLKFNIPTDIQAATLPISINNSRDVIGVAQTGSGKTLAYSLPILQWIASHSIEDRQMRLLEGVRDDEISCRLAGLVLTPTRELAIQVAKHINSLIEHSSSSPSGKKKWASVATVTGGMSEEKQKRTLQGFRGRGADIIVATPGRLWELCCGDDALARRIKTTKFLVVDEADRMIETGHFAEMQNIFALVQRLEEEQNEDKEEGSHTHRTDTHLARVLGGASDMQTFIYSATLSKDLQQNLKRANRMKRRRKGKNVASTLDELLEAIDFRDDEPFMVDQSTLTRVATNVMEVKIECIAKDKDLYLYYFLLRYPGRTLVFVNSIDGIRRLQPLLQNLKINVQPLHSQLQQRQRLKNMDRFRSTNKTQSSVLLATDVAARGLDIANVDHVVHFQVPRTADTYVHRSGRTARGGKDGVALVLIEPSEMRVWQDLCKSLSTEKDKRKDDIQSMPIEYTFLNALKQRVNLGRQIDQATHKQKKANHDDAWLRKLAEEVEMDLSGEEEEGEDTNNKKSAKVKDNKKVLALKAELDHLIKTPLRARGISGKYLTSGSEDFVNSLLNDQQHESLIGVQKTTVQQDVAKPKTKRKPSQEQAKPVNSSSQQKRKRV